MLFNSQHFILLFLPITLAVFLFLSQREGTKASLVWLITASMFFYGWWNPGYVPLLAGSVLVNYTLAHLIVHQVRKSRRRTLLMVLGVGFNLTLLAYYKYANFLLGNISELTGSAFSLTATALPLAISFYTFQQISYLVDVWKSRGKEYDLLRYAAYVTFFPQLIAGPIVRHHELIPQFASNPLREGLWERLGRGGVMFGIGLAKKVLIADSLAEIVDPIYAVAASEGTVPFTDAWMAAIAFVWQIYFDFSGYSDMALGLALMFGFKLPFNFDAPYRAASLRQIWQRWHMTLSRFLRDYLFIPLARNKWLGQSRFSAILITMFLGGLWHGAAWTFVCWGLAHGVGLAVNTVFTRAGYRLPKGMGWLLTILFWIEMAVLFRADSFATVGTIWSGMHGLGAGFGGIDSGDFALVVVSGILAILGPTSQTFVFERMAPRKWLALTVGLLVSGILVIIGEGTEQEFIYFQF